MLFAAAATALPAQTFTTLNSFDGADGMTPWAALVQATNGNGYGTTQQGGANGSGNVFKIAPNGALTSLYSFGSQSGDGVEPLAGLVQAGNGDLYGTTYNGGANSGGAVFKITPSGTLTTLYSFCSQTNCTDGKQPGHAGLILGSNGDLYGTTEEGGVNVNACPPFIGCGTVFKITPAGTLTTLYSFCAQSGCTDGEVPYAGLVQATNGDFYGTTEFGGSNGLFAGTVFKITPSGTLTTIYSFCAQSRCADGKLPDSTLVQAANGDFYGTTGDGGAYSIYGTIFRITPSGTLTTLYSFSMQDSASGLVQGTDGNFYGTTRNGGTNEGTVFKITPTGTLTTVYPFCSQGPPCTDGSNPIAGLVQATNGDFYGTTTYGGANGDGTVFGISVGLGPFVETLPTLGKVGRAVKILGTDLTGATSVSFNGTAAEFKVVSKSLIETLVPTGATTGFVTVTTPTRTLKSNVKFRVRP